MKKFITLVLGIIVFLNIANICHGETPSKKDVYSMVKKYIDDKVKNSRSKTFNIQDPVYGMNRRLMLLSMQDKVGKTGKYYYCSALFRDMDNNQILLVDIDVGQKDEESPWKVEKSNIREVGGKRRYIYDRNGKRIPLQR